MSKNKLLFFLILLLGIAGFFLRAVQLRFGFETGSGLAVTGFLPGTVLVLLTAVLVFAALLSARMLPLPTKPDRFLRLQGKPSAAVHSAAGALNALMGVSLAAAGLHGSRLDLLLGIVSLLTALYLFLPPRASEKLRMFCFAENTLFYVVWLIVLFSRHASDPVLMGFWPPLLALCATVFSFYFLTCAACCLFKPRRCLFSLLLGGSLCLIAAADGCSFSAVSGLFGFLAAALVQFFYIYRLLFSE